MVLLSPIEAGTVIKGEAGSGANATALIIARGGKIMANGTAVEPIIFTTVADQITTGQIEKSKYGCNTERPLGWFLILVKHLFPASGNAESVQIEGIPASDINGLYGGSDPADNSGVFTYVSIDMVVPISVKVMKSTD